MNKSSTVNDVPRYLSHNLMSGIMTSSLYAFPTPAPFYKSKKRQSFPYT